METRVNKYNNDTSTMSRAKRNQNLYNEISELQMDSFDVNSNSQIISNNGTTINIERLKDMLDKKYREDKVRKPIGTFDENEVREEIKLDETREYDINEILSKAREKKQDDYEVERLKKLRNTQVDILNDLNIESLNKINKVKAVSDDEKDELKTLIDTINLTEETNAIKNIEDMDPLDLLDELKGDDDETKIDGVSELTEEIIKQAKIEAAKEIIEERKEKIDKEKENSKELEPEDQKMDKSFYTNSTVFKTDDFDDFSDLKNDISATKVVIRILIVLIVIAFICGVVFLLNKVLNWGLF